MIMWHMTEEHCWGIPFIWWMPFIILIFWIFIWPINLFGLRKYKDTPLDILKKRLANGDIDEEEYEKCKKVLEKD